MTSVRPSTPTVGTGAAAHGGVSSPESSRREVSAGTHFAALDGYRAIAALMVVVTHIATTTNTVSGAWGHIWGRFDFGVALFFLMSGFLLYRPWVRAALEGRPRPHLARYALRRAARILPLYWVVVVVTLRFLPDIQPVSGEQWWRHLLALQIYQVSGPVEGLYQTWSLCTEISFYVLLPLLGLAALGRTSKDPARAWRRQVTVLVVLVAVAAVYNGVRLVTDLLPFQANFWLPAYLDWFAAGMALALIEVRSRQPQPPRIVAVAVSLARDRTTALILAASVFAVACTPVAGSYLFTANTPWQNAIKHELYLLAAFFFLLPGVMASGTGWARILSTRVLAYLGLISYGIFLWHLMLLRLLLPAMGIAVFTGGALRVGAALLVLTIAISSVTYFLVERPAQRWAHRY